MYTAVRTILLVTILLIGIITIRKLIAKQWQRILAIVLCMVLVSVVSAFPFENLFYSFESPEKVFNYIGKDELTGIVYGEDSCLIYYETEKNTYSYTYCKKHEDRYKLLSHFSCKKVSKSFDSNGSYEVYNVLGTNDYYVFIFAVKPISKLEIYDDKDNKIKTEILRVKDTGFIVFSVTNFTDKHYLLIDSNKVLIAQESN